MIQIHVRLFGILRDKLPRAAKGRTTLSLPEGATIRTVLDHFEVLHHVSFAVNEEIDLEDSHKLNDGDSVEIFRVSAGG